MYSEHLPIDLTRYDLDTYNVPELVVVGKPNEAEPRETLNDYLDYAKTLDLKTYAMAEYLAHANRVHASSNLQEISMRPDELVATDEAELVRDHSGLDRLEDVDPAGENSTYVPSTVIDDEPVMDQTTEVHSTEADPDKQSKATIPFQLGVEFGYLSGKKSIRAIRFRRRTVVEQLESIEANVQLTVEQDEQVKGISKRLTKTEKPDNMKLRKIIGNSDRESVNLISGIGHTELGIRPIVERKSGKVAAVTGWLGAAAIAGSSLYCARQFFNW